jgi:hypothetical protein
MVVTLGIVLIALQAWAQTEKTLYNFNCATDGCEPYSGLTWDSAQTHLYGTTSSAGPDNEGTVFELSYSKQKGIEYQVIFSFNNTTTGRLVYSNLTYYKGALFGTADQGGDPTCQCGVVFELKEVNGTWNETVLHTFKGGTTDGSFPYGGVTFDSKGNLYGTTEHGGTGTTNCGGGCGTVYELSEVKGKIQFNILYSFQGSHLGGPYDGSMPMGTLAIDAAGNLYGTTCCSGMNGGNIFEVSPTRNGGWSYQTLFFFDGTTTGSDPNAGVVLDAEGNLYGTVPLAATAYELSNQEVYSILYDQNDVVDSMAPLAFDSAGNLYGTTFSDRNGGNGTVFKLTAPDWAPSVVYVFTGSQGSLIQSPVSLDKKGNIYGTAYNGGSNNQGVIYEIVQ